MEIGVKCIAEFFHWSDRVGNLFGQIPLMFLFGKLDFHASISSVFATQVRHPLSYFVFAEYTTEHFQSVAVSASS